MIFKFIISIVVKFYDSGCIENWKWDLMVNNIVWLYKRFNMCWFIGKIVCMWMWFSILN